MWPGWPCPPHPYGGWRRSDGRGGCWCHEFVQRGQRNRAEHATRIDRVGTGADDRTLAGEIHRVDCAVGPDLGACLEDLRERLDEVGADDGGEQALLSPLSRLACCAAAAASFGGAELSRAYWETLSQTQARSGDGLGATLRLLAMMALNGNIWFDQALGEVAAD